MPIKYVTVITPCFRTPFVFGHPLFFTEIIIFSVRKHGVITVMYYSNCIVCKASHITILVLATNPPATVTTTQGSDFISINVYK